MTDDDGGTDDGEQTAPGAEEPASLDGFDPDEPDDGSGDTSSGDDGTGGFQFGASPSSDEPSDAGEEPSDDGDEGPIDLGDDGDADPGPDPDPGPGSAATGDPAEREPDGEDGPDDTLDLEGDATDDDTEESDEAVAATPSMSPFASGPSEDAVDTDGATDEAVAAALAEVDLEETPVPSLGTDGGQSGGAIADPGGVGPALGPGEPGDAAPDRPRVSTAVADPETVDARFVVACPACEYVAGDDALLPVAAARAKHAAHAGDGHLPRWIRTEGLVTPETFMTTEVRTVACEECGTERWIADRATAQEFARDHETYTTHGALEVTTRHVEAPSPEGLLAVVLALTDPPGGAADVGDDPVAGVESAVVEAAFVDGAGRAFEPDEDAEALAARTARAVEWRLRRLREHGRLAVEERPADPDTDGTDDPRRLLRVTDRGREMVESTVPEDGLGELSIDGD